MFKLKMTRKEFLWTGLSAAVVGLWPPGFAKGKSAAGDAAAAVSPLIAHLNPILRLYPAGAIERTGDIRYGMGELQVMLPFFGSGEVTWELTVPAGGTYQVAACYSSTVPGSNLDILSGDSKIHHGVQVTEGYFFPYPGGPSSNPGDPDDSSFWSERQFYSFERVSLAGQLVLARGVNVVKLRVSGPKGGENFRLRSLELIPVAQLTTILASQDLARRRRANTDWFVKAGYGVWFHFLDLTTPRRGPSKSYQDAVNDLDVEALAGLVEDTGAGYVIINTNHGHPTCPAPIKSWEELHPGWTTHRDLIGDLADALMKRGIKLMLYMNCPGLGDLAQLPRTGVDVATVSEERYAEILTRVFTEIGLRYRNKVAGYWLDSWFQTDESYPNLPFDKLFDAIKAGYPDRLVAYNYWAFPIETEWQDYWAGELTDLPLKRFRTRYADRGAGKGLQAHGAIKLDAPWFHTAPDTNMEPPLFTAEQLIAYVRTCMEDQAVVSIGVGIFQDGTIGEESRQILRELRQAIRKA
jgi:Alpha-L-fucosidase